MDNLFYSRSKTSFVDDYYNELITYTSVYMDFQIVKAYQMQKEDNDDGKPIKQRNY